MILKTAHCFGLGLEFTVLIPSLDRFTAWIGLYHTEYIICGSVILISTLVVGRCRGSAVLLMKLQSLKDITEPLNKSQLGIYRTVGDS